METKSRPVDVISVCSADGQIRPLRLQLEDENRQLLRINIERIMDVKDISHVGIEGQIFRCRATVWEKVWIFELKYTFRNHTWQMMGRIH